MFFKRFNVPYRRSVDRFNRFLLYKLPCLTTFTKEPPDKLFLCFYLSFPLLFVALLLHDVLLNSPLCPARLCSSRCSATFFYIWARISAKISICRWRSCSFAVAIFSFARSMADRRSSCSCPINVNAASLIFGVLVPGRVIKSFHSASKSRSF